MCVCALVIHIHILRGSRNLNPGGGPGDHSLLGVLRGSWANTADGRLTDIDLSGMAEDESDQRASEGVCIMTSKTKTKAGGNNRRPRPRLTRTTLQTSRLMDFCSRKELIAQTGHQPDAWPLVILKELVDNALDACEDAETPPQIDVTVNDAGLSVADNGPGIPADTIGGVLDFGVRVSNREAYVAPDRGAQGNALKTIVAMPYVLDGDRGQVDILAHGVRHRITLRVDRIRQEPVIRHEEEPNQNVRTGTTVTVQWPDSACSILADAKERFLQIAADYTWLNPHLNMTVDWLGEQTRIKATATEWKKWLPSDPTCIR